MKINLKEDLATLTTINESTLTKLTSKAEWCISDGIVKALLNNESELSVDIDIGELILYFSDDEIKYRFIPNQRFKKIVSNAVVNERNDLVLNVENTLVSKLNNVYKNFF